jgi:hypothetical protein
MAVAPVGMVFMAVIVVFVTMRLVPVVVVIMIMAMPVVVRLRLAVGLAADDAAGGHDDVLYGAHVLIVAGMGMLVRVRMIVAVLMSVVVVVGVVVSRMVVRPMSMILPVPMVMIMFMAVVMAVVMAALGRLGLGGVLVAAGGDGLFRIAHGLDYAGLIRMMDSAGHYGAPAEPHIW